jgi:hypothetical protein
MVLCVACYMSLMLSMQVLALGVEYCRLAL